MRIKIKHSFRSLWTPTNSLAAVYCNKPPRYSSTLSMSRKTHPKSSKWVTRPTQISYSPCYPISITPSASHLPAGCHASWHLEIFNKWRPYHEGQWVFWRVRVSVTRFPDFWRNMRNGIGADRVIEDAVEGEETVMIRFIIFRRFLGKTVTWGRVLEQRILKLIYWSW